MLEQVGIYELLILLGLSILPIIVSLKLGIKIVSESFIAIARMIVQLLLLGVYLEFIISINSIWLTLGYFMVMTTVTGITVSGHAELKSFKINLLIIAAVLSVNLLLLIAANYTILPLSASFDAHYLIPVSGMLLGNTLNGCIIAVRNFKKYAVENRSLYYFHRSLGMSDFKAAVLWIKSALEESIRPGVASMATIGLISLPGMMTGQILAGQSPMTAISYQLAIMLLIYVSRFFSSYVSLVMLSKIYGTDSLISTQK